MNEKLTKVYQVSSETRGIYKLVHLKICLDAEDISNGKEEFFAWNGGVVVSMNYQTSIEDGVWRDPFITDFNLHTSRYIDDLRRSLTVLNRFLGLLDYDERSLFSNDFSTIAKIVRSRRFVELAKFPDYSYGAAPASKIIAGRYCYDLNEVMEDRSRTILHVYLDREDAELDEVRRAAVEMLVRQLSYDQSWFSQSAILSDLSIASGANVQHWRNEYCDLSEEHTLDAVTALYENSPAEVSHV